MRVLVTGTTGFVGQYVAQALLAAGHEVVALVRPGHEQRLGSLAPRVTAAFGDVTQPHTLPHALAGVEAVVHLVGILKEDPARHLSFEKLHWLATRDLADAAKAAGVRRFIHMSALGARPDGTPYQATKFHAEEYVRGVGLDWTVMQPSVIFGDPHGRMSFVTELAAPMRLLPAFPLFGEGDERLQPVHVEDVALAFVRALERPGTIGQTFCLGGPEALPYRLVARIIATALGRPDLPFIPVPLPLVHLGVELGAWLPGFPLTRDQLAMLLEGSTCVDASWEAALGLNPRPFTPAALDYLRGQAAFAR